MGDPCYTVRKAVAGCIHELTKILGKKLCTASFHNIYSYTKFESIRLAYWIFLMRNCTTITETCCHSLQNTVKYTISLSNEL